MNNIRSILFNQENITIKYPWIIIIVNHGESREEAWTRHLLAHPEDKEVKFKIFHHKLA